MSSSSDTTINTTNNNNNSLYEKAKRRLKLETPASQAVTYSQLELPYHAPPIIYKISNVVEATNSGGITGTSGSTLFERVNTTWKGSKDELRSNEKALARIRKDQIVQSPTNSSSSSTPSNSSSSSEQNNNQNNTPTITNNIGDFLAYFFLKGNYPDIEWKSIASSPSSPTSESTNNNTNNNIIANLFSKEHSILSKKSNYMWAIDANFQFIFAPEHQIDFALQRIRVKHGDLTANGKTMMGSIETLTVGRLPARLGGEFRWDESKGRWRIDNDSSYCFFREDHLVISNTANVKWQIITELYLRSLGVKTNDILWLDLVQSRKLDSFIVQRLSKAFVRLKRDDEKEAAISDIGSKFSLVNLFRGVNLFDSVFEAFGAKSFFCTLGKLSVDILEVSNLSYVDMFKSFQHAYSYCSVGLRGSDTNVDHQNWWDRYYQTKTVKRNQNPQFNESFTLYVTSMDIQILDLKVYHSKHQLLPVLLGECELELCDLNFKEFDELDLWLPLTVPKGILDISIGSGSSSGSGGVISSGSSSGGDGDDNDVQKLNNIFSSTSLVQVDSISQQASPTIVGSMVGIGSNLKKITGNDGSSSTRIGNVSVKPVTSTTTGMSMHTLNIPSKADQMIHIKLRWEPHVKSNNNDNSSCGSTNNCETSKEEERLFTFDEIMKEEQQEQTENLQ